ncbi:cytochrome P450 [Streptomyces ipomoeae]|jgi:cytochrome P450|uniref:Unspecific monooxygenase n=2 Tax=Streptomyces ipomoeae TaxID=103232 RepID=L1L0N5_9ACTN|nr:cytochrome P450 [Streptomyces ipomoeae]EKX66334.1 unspecific monooxygenase [Streptomyces ipomoeae 91-03]MDX2694290.1 cytochrome P450 [Streptomyces ipomoeae]MDX2840243.1 cytochrome P450 [Streptomyces ipomoeae]TQE32900.1 cytochrome P450 [Streptomyces ipomoeae]TQE40224.1 cytochrome P450 [Streptomyces ipomoeae]
MTQAFASEEFEALSSEEAAAAASSCSREFRANPHPVYAALRETAPVCPLSPPHGVETYLITRYDDARAALADPRLSKDMYGAIDAYHRIFGDSSIALDDNMLFSDPPKHTRLRRIVGSTFTPKRVESLRPRVQQITEDLLDQCPTAGAVNLLPEFCFPLPLHVICELLGVPENERKQAQEWSATVAQTGFGPEARKALEVAEGNLRDYLVDLCARKRREPDQGLLSALVTAKDQEGALTDHELVSTAWVLLFAGHKSTAYQIGNAVYHLLSRPDQKELALRDANSMNAAMEEIFRFESSVENSTFRYAKEDVVIRDTLIPKGALVQISITGANRDPEMFAAPNELDVRRPNVQATHLSFGYGPHYCIGAPLARLEMQVALTTLFGRYPRMTLVGAPEEARWLTVPFPAFRGLAELPVTLDPS